MKYKNRLHFSRLENIHEEEVSEWIWHTFFRAKKTWLNLDYLYHICKVYSVNLVTIGIEICEVFLLTSTFTIGRGATNFYTDLIFQKGPPPVPPISPRLVSWKDR